MFDNDFRNTIKDFEIIKPKLETILQGRILSVEGAGELAKALDCLCGIDYLIIQSKGVRGIASRIQHGKCWRTFTIRKEKASGAKTEYEKRTDGIRHDFIYPYYTVQAYKDNGTIRGAICHTKELYECVEHGAYRENSTSNADFLIVDWDDLPHREFFGYYL